MRRFDHISDCLRAAANESIALIRKYTVLISLNCFTFKSALEGRKMCDSKVLIE